jgi:hypothetical protein
MSFEDEPTQQLRRPAPPAPMPGPLDLTATPSDASAAPDAETGTDQTDVLSLDEMLSPPAPVSSREPAPVQSAPTAMAAPTVTTEPVEALPRGSVELARPAGPSLARRVGTDARAAVDAGWRRGRTWIGEADNLLIAATVLVALLLIIVVAVI